jgi:hypothetical protein
MKQSGAGAPMLKSSGLRMLIMQVLDFRHLISCQARAMKIIMAGTPIAIQ